MLEKTVVLLKVPEWDPDSKTISALVEEDLNRLGFKYKSIGIYLDEAELSNIYSNLNELIFNTTIAQLAFQPLQVFRVYGDNAVNVIHNLKGTKTEPLECDISSWRHRLALKFRAVRHVKLRRCDGSHIVTIVNNFVHAPGSDDVERNIQVFRKYFGQI